MSHSNTALLTREKSQRMLNGKLIIDCSGRWRKKYRWPRHGRKAPTGKKLANVVPTGILADHWTSFAVYIYIYMCVCLSSGRGQIELGEGSIGVARLEICWSLVLESRSDQNRIPAILPLRWAQRMQVHLPGLHSSRFFWLRNTKALGKGSDQAACDDVLSQ